MTKQEQQKLIEELKDDVFELRQELLFKNERIKQLKDMVNKLKEEFEKINLTINLTYKKYANEKKKT